MLSLLALFLLAFTPVTAHTSHKASYSDQDALLAFKKAVLVDPYKSLINWTPNVTFCNWTGVACSSRRERVISLNLTGMALLGSISPYLGNLSFISTLSLKNNSFEGQIPPQLGRLFRLRILRLSRNDLEGSIPAELGDCRSLQSLTLSYNNLSGSIPPQLGLLSKLETIALGVNQLTGTIPAYMGNMSSLTQLDLGTNRLHGNIPDELGMLSQLTLLLLGINLLTGPAPSSLVNCTRLQTLDLVDNQLIGHIPWQFGKLVQLQSLLLWGNQLTGEIPSSLSNCTQLQELVLDINKLSGMVPLEFGSLLQLTEFAVRQNYLVSGSNHLSILTAISNCSKLEILDLGRNNFAGVITPSIGLLSGDLSLFFLDSNQIEGSIPGEIGNLTKLTRIDFSGNRFSGNIPTTLSKLLNLERLSLATNNLQGRVPNSLGAAKGLGLLSLSENGLSGQIPDSLGNLSQLRYIYLDHNNLSGEIPASLGRCRSLMLLDLAYNSLAGSIPPEVAGLKDLQFYFNVSSNMLQGSLLEMSNLVMVQAIDVSMNKFSDGIPSALASCIALEYINLSWNAFSGPIPASLAKLVNLQVMDLSSNNLTGTIPENFKDMKMLRHVNLSSNRLTGEVPRGGVFAEMDVSGLVNNLGLCGTWINLPACSHSKHNHPSLSKKVIIPVVVGISIFILSFLVLAFSYISRQRKISLLDVWPPRILYDELVGATGGFSEANLIGIGGFGSIYKGVLKNGKNVAVKVFNFQDENAHQSFSKECKILKRVRHRNIIRIISTFSNLEIKALVLPFMSNGSLEKWLYPSGRDECILNLSDRLRIAIEIAHGMAYLHHHCFVQVIHCDLKPNNILLGDDMTSYVADFGISKLLFGDSMDSLTFTNALKGSIGYIAPEYGMGGRVSTKGDVYSYGILLLELLTRRKPMDDMFVEGTNLRGWVGMNFPNKITEVVDKAVLTNVNESEMTMALSCLTHLMEVGLVCTRELPQQRPNMAEIVDRLEKIRDTFNGIHEGFQLPIDISHLIEDTGHARIMNPDNHENWSTSTY
ncbi:hypothetical protein SUGI_0377580 [Cryptomeria japonica]|uniref:putative leucine-rich repeat receptor-like serine/threonine-protein kinase At2g24130 n=1 Tax=Cryptomeria japonica TaxID=3369 RepID=UPI002408E9A7|nr:putative leucine-rich repeat receptor-like serine/threonine-protein kinase At2g24130 [Cryptomeria japonica]GLJ20728.1 hypothetical protein SUGI_0377580 [Cryptomeria japonica]